MKKLLLAVLLAPAMTAPAATPNPADYTIPVHVLQSTGIGAQSFIAAIDGQTVALDVTSLYPGVFLPGDYKAKLTKDVTHHGSDLEREYRLLLPDGTDRLVYVVGLCAKDASSCALASPHL